MRFLENTILQFSRAVERGNIQENKSPDCKILKGYVIEKQ